VWKSEDVSDNPQWAAPGASQPTGPARQPVPTSPPPPPNGYAAPAPLQYAPVQPGQGPGWTPPPKPGLVPLRPLTLGNILGASFQVMRRNPRTTLVPALLLAVITALATGGGIALVFGSLSRLTTTTNAADASALGAGALLLALLVAVVGGALTLTATAVLQALIATEIGRGAVGERQTFAQAWARARGRFGAVIGYAALLVVTIVVAVIVVFALLTGVTAVIATGSNSQAAIGASVAVIFLGELLVFAGGGVLWAWLGTKLAFVPSAIVLERLPVRAAIARSWRLTRHAFWRTFGILLLVYAMVYLVTSFVSAPVQLIAFLGGGLVDPVGASSSDPLAMFNTLIWVFVAVYVVQAFVGSLGMVLESATASLLYLDQRMRREGLDLELARYVEQRAVGADLPDPFVPQPAPRTAP